MLLCYFNLVSIAKKGVGCMDLIFSFLGYQMGIAPLVIWIIVALVIAGTIWFIREIKDDYKGLCYSLENVLSELRKYKSQISIEDLNDVEDVFIDSKFKNKPFLKDIWVEFDETLEKDRRNNKVYNTLQSEDFFNRSSIISANIKHIDLIKAAPSILTAVGLLGTFLAILIGLHHVQVLQGGQVKGIEGLINGLSGKFLSSIVALLCSIGLTIYEKTRFSKLTRICSEIQRTMNRIFPRKSTEKLLIEVLKHNEEQSSALKSFNTDLSGHLKAGVQEGIAPLVESLMATLEQIKKEKQESSSEAMGQMIGEFKSSLTGVAGKEMESMATVMANITTTLSNFDTNNKEFENRVNFMIDNLDRVTTNQQQQFVTHVNQVNEIITSQANNFDDIMNEFEAKVNQYQDLVDKNTQMQRELQGISSIMAHAGEQFSASADGFEEINGSIDRLVKLSAQDQERFKQSVEQWNSQTQTIQNLEKSIANILDNVHQSLVSYSQQTNNSLKEYLVQYDEQMANSTKRLSSNILDLDEKLEDLSSILGQRVGEIKMIQEEGAAING